MSQHRRKADGRPKVGYDTEEEALAAANPAAGQSVYQCSICGRWHMGHRIGSTFHSQRNAKIKRRRKDSYR